jgi:hypothetical protein
MPRLPIAVPPTHQPSISQSPRPVRSELRHHKSMGRIDHSQPEDTRSSLQLQKSIKVQNNLRLTFYFI